MENGLKNTVYTLFIRDSLQLQRHKDVQSKIMEKVIYAKRNQKRAEVTILLSDKIDFKSKRLQEQRWILYTDKSFTLSRVYDKNIYAPNKRNTYEAETSRTEDRSIICTLTGGDSTHLEKQDKAL